MPSILRRVRPVMTIDHTLKTILALSALAIAHNVRTAEFIPLGSDVKH